MDQVRELEVHGLLKEEPFIPDRAEVTGSARKGGACPPELTSNAKVSQLFVSILILAQKVR